MYRNTHHKPLKTEDIKLENQQIRRSEGMGRMKKMKSTENYNPDPMLDSITENQSDFDFSQDAMDLPEIVNDQYVQQNMNNGYSPY